jgi:hypothetical protein
MHKLKPAGSIQEKKAMRKTRKLKGEAFQGCDIEPIPAF